MNVAVLLAGGHGARMGSTLPKQFLPLKGRTIIEHTVDTFEKNPNIDEIAVVMHRDYIDRMKGIAAVNRWSKLKHIIVGGSERYMSSTSALEVYQGYPSDTRIIFHDAVRPLVSQRIINDVVVALNQYVAVGVCVESTDTIWQVSDGTISSIPQRATLRRAQTPQAFHLDTIAKAYRIGLQHRPFACTDDCGVVLQYMPEVPIHIVDGDAANIKITVPEDLPIAESLMRKNNI